MPIITVISLFVLALLIYVMVRFKDDCDFNWFNGRKPRLDSPKNSADFWPQSEQDATAAKRAGRRSKVFQGERPGR